MISNNQLAELEAEASELRSENERLKGMNEFLTEAVKKTQELQARLMVAREALQWAYEMFLARDERNAKVHCAPLRVSPITERTRQAIDCIDGRSKHVTLTLVKSAEEQLALYEGALREVGYQRNRLISALRDLCEGAERQGGGFDALDELDRARATLKDCGVEG